MLQTIVEHRAATLLITISASAPWSNSSASRNLTINP